MVENTYCGNCGNLIEEASDTPIDMRRPYEKCGSTKRNFTVEILESLQISSEINPIVISYPDSLLTITNNLINQGLYNIAIVTVILVCEVAIERTFDCIFRSKNISDIGEAIKGLMNGNSLANDKHRKLFNSLVNINIENQKFWQNYKNSCAKRNSIIHKGGHGSKNDAITAHNASKDLQNFLNTLTL
jgi:hypothetical protein